MNEYDYYLDDDYSEHVVDRIQERAQRDLLVFFEENRRRVFFVSQLTIFFEKKYFHWVTNRSIKYIEAMGLIKTEERELKSGSKIKLLWHNKYSYFRREAQRIQQLVEEYAEANVGGAIGLHGESMVLEGLAKHQFLMKGRNTKEYNP